MSAAPSTPGGQELGAGTVKCLFEGWMATIPESGGSWCDGWTFDSDLGPL